MRRFVTVAALGIGVWFAALGETNRYAGPAFAFEEPAEILRTAAEITAAKYPDSDQAVVEQRLVREYRADGLADCQDESWVKVLTEKGKRAARTISLGYMLPYSTAEVLRLEVYHVNGEKVVIDVAANSKESIDDSQMQSNIFDPNSRVLRVNIPQLEVGDTVHSIARETIERPFIPGQFSEQAVMEGRAYIRHLSYEVRGPAERPLKRIAVRDEVAGTLRYSTHSEPEGVVVHHWEAVNVPRIFDEPGMPADANILQRVCVSTVPDWETVSRWYWELSKPHLEATSPELRDTVAGLTAGAKGEMDRIGRLFHHVAGSIRYMGLTPEKDRPGFEPHDVKLTFGKKYGVCRDKAALLVSMLNAADVKAFPVLISLGVRRDPEVPDWEFNHAIVCAETADGRRVLMDPTDENTRELLPSYDCHQSYLVCRPEGAGLALSPVEPPAQNLMVVKTTGSLSPDGAFEGRSELRFGGVNDDAYRNMFAQMKPDDKRRFFERLIKHAMPGAKLGALKLLPEDMLDVGSELSAQIEYSAGGLTAEGAGKAVVEVPWIGRGLGVVSFMLEGAGLDKRRYPMDTQLTCGIREEVSVRLKAGFGAALSMPSSDPVDDETLGYQRRYALQDGELRCSRQFELRTVEFSPDQYLRLKHTLKGMEYDDRKAPVFGLAGAPEPATGISRAAAPAAAEEVNSDAEILESRKELTVVDAHTATYRVKYSKRILTYNGKKREAELKVDYNPAYQEARLVRGTVISKDGKRQEISKDEINVMDQGWNASAKRYTGGKLLVANLPGVEIGSTIEVEFEITSRGAQFLAGFESFQMGDALDKKTFRLTAPATVPVRRLVSGEAKALRQESSSGPAGQVFEWGIDHSKALPAEGGVPPPWIYNTGVEFFVGDAGEYFRGLRAAMSAHAAKGAAAAKIARRLSGAASNKLAAVQAIRDFVVKSIRRSGPSFTDLPLGELSDADRTLADGYGHAADQAILLHSMLTAAGFQPEFVLGSGLPPVKAIEQVAKSFPLPQSFATPLVRVAVGGERYYLNDTDQYARLGVTPHDGRLGLPLGATAPELIQAAKGCGDETETEYRVTVEDDGNATIKVTRHYFGGHYGQKKRYFAELPPEERARYAQELVSSVAQGARPAEELVTRFDVYPGLEEFAVRVEGYAVVDGDYLYFDLPASPTLFPAGADRRSLPLLFPQKTRSLTHTEILLPRHFAKVAMSPRSEVLEVPGGLGAARVTAAKSPGKLEITHDFRTKPGILPPKDYAALLSVDSALGRSSERVVLLERTNPKPLAGLGGTP